jgi:hypothetical protein
MKDLQIIIHLVETQDDDQDVIEKEKQIALLINSTSVTETTLGLYQVLQGVCPDFNTT